jgi:hypothetical protein
MPNLPNLDIAEISYLFTAVLTTVAVFWSINKAIIFAKTH